MPQQRPQRCTRLFPNMHKEGALFPLATARHKYEIDMCTGSLPQKILLFSLPLMATGMLQLLFNAADIIVVGRYVGSHALAAALFPMISVAWYYPSLQDIKKFNIERKCRLKL